MERSLWGPYQNEPHILQATIMALCSLGNSTTTYLHAANSYLVSSVLAISVIGWRWLLLTGGGIRGAKLRLIAFLHPFSSNKNVGAKGKWGEGGLESGNFRWRLMSERLMR